MMKNIGPCQTCGGSGKIIKEKCPTCRGAAYVSKRVKLEVNVPAGIDNGQSIRIKDKGEPGRNGGPRGDLYVEVYVADSDKYIRDGLDIYTTCSISFTQAALGGEIRIPTVYGDVLYEVKEGTQSHTRIRLKNKGVPSVRNNAIKGNQYVDLIVETPVKLNQAARDALRALDEALGNTPSADGAKPKRKGFRKK